MSDQQHHNSTQSLDEILAELEQHFGTASEASSHSATQTHNTAKKSSSPKLAIATLALFVSLSAALGAAYLTSSPVKTQQIAEVVAQQDVTGVVQGLTTTEPEIMLPEYSPELITTPITLTDNLVESVLGLTCDGTICALANTSWTWTNSTGQQIPVSCNTTQDIWRFYCPDATAASASCTQNPTRVATASAGETLDLSTYLTTGSGVYQFHFTESQALPSAAMCGALVVRR